MISQMLGIEPGEIEATIAQVQTLARDVDSRLEAIENMHRRSLGALLLLVVLADESRDDDGRVLADAERAMYAREAFALLAGVRSEHDEPEADAT